MRGYSCGRAARGASPRIAATRAAARLVGGRANGRHPRAHVPAAGNARIHLAGVEDDVEDEVVKMYNTKALIQATRRIKQYGRERQPNLAIRTLADLASQGVQPDRIAATAVIDACVASNKMDLAENVFSELFGKGDFMRPDEVTYAVLIKGYGQDLAHPNWTKIRQMLQTMETSGIDLTICTYNALLEICANSNDWQRGMQVLDQVYDKSVSPDQNTLEIVKKRKTLRAHFKKLFS